MDSEILVEGCCVAFIDILGFKEMTNSLEKIKEFSHTINEAIDIMKNRYIDNKSFESVNNESIFCIQGADSVFYIFPKSFNYIYVMISRLCVMQLMLASKGIYVRGSINTGCMYIDKVNNVFFGDAWNKAVTSEATAIVPRIIIENSIAKVFEDRLRYINEGVMEFTLDTDGNYILSSYGIYSSIQLAKTKEAEEDLYNEVFKNLLHNINKNRENRSILQKYLWIAKQIEQQHYGETKNKAEEISKYIISLLLLL